MTISTRRKSPERHDTDQEAYLAAGPVVHLAGERILLDNMGVALMPDHACLIVSDLHLEKGSYYARRRNYLPPYDTRNTLLRLAALVERHRPQLIISLGDSFHDNDGAQRLSEADRNFLYSLMAGRNWVWISGNHDPDLPPDLPGDRCRELALGSLVLRHEPAGQKNVAGEIAGHLHPGARIVHRGRSVRRACFAVDENRIIMPAFGAYTGCLNVMNEPVVSLFQPESFRSYMLGDQRLFAVSRKHLCRDR